MRTCSSHRRPGIDVLALTCRRLGDDALAMKPRGVFNVPRAAAERGSRRSSFTPLPRWLPSASASVQFAAPKGTLPHRTVGWIWVGLMAAVAASSFWIHEIRLLGPLEPDPSAVDLHADHAADRGVDARQAQGSRDHRQITMMSSFVGALVIAGLFTLLPGRIMHAVVFGQ